MLDIIAVVLAVLLAQIPSYVLAVWMFRHAIVRRVVGDESALSPLGTAARAQEAEEGVRLARLARTESTEAWNAAGRPD